MEHTTLDDFTCLKEYDEDNAKSYLKSLPSDDYLNEGPESDLDTELEKCAKILNLDLGTELDSLNYQNEMLIMNAENLEDFLRNDSSSPLETDVVTKRDFKSEDVKLDLISNTNPEKVCSKSSNLELNSFSLDIKSSFLEKTGLQFGPVKNISSNLVKNFELHKEKSDFIEYSPLEYLDMFEPAPSPSLSESPILDTDNNANRKIATDEANRAYFNADEVHAEIGNESNQKDSESTLYNAIQMQVSPHSIKTLKTSLDDKNMKRECERNQLEIDSDLKLDKSGILGIKVENIMIKQPNEQMSEAHNSQDGKACMDNSNTYFCNERENTSAIKEGENALETDHNNLNLKFFSNDSKNTSCDEKTHLKKCGQSSPSKLENDCSIISFFNSVFKQKNLAKSDDVQKIHDILQDTIENVVQKKFEEKDPKKNVTSNKLLLENNKTSNHTEIPIQNKNLSHKITTDKHTNMIDSKNIVSSKETLQNKTSINQTTDSKLRSPTKKSTPEKRQSSRIFQLAVKSINNCNLLNNNMSAINKSSSPESNRSRTVNGGLLKNDGINNMSAISKIPNSESNRSRTIDGGLPKNGGIKNNKETESGPNKGTSNTKAVASCADNGMVLIKDNSKDNIDYFEDEEEDLVNPEWEAIKNLTTNEERYQQVRKCWGSKKVPDPNKNLTYHSFRKRIFGSEAKVITQHKRRASTDLNGKSAKRLCTFFLDKEIDAVRKLAEKQKQAIENEKLYKISKVNEQCYQREIELQTRYYDSYNSYGTAILRQQLEDSVREIKETCSIRQRTCPFRGQVKALTERRNEVLKFNEFYQGLSDSNTAELTETQFEELDEIDDVFKQLHYYYESE